MAEIDQLSIGIEAEAPKAEKTIDSLVGKLDVLVKRLSAVTTTPVKINIDTSKFDKIGKSLKLDGLDKAAKVIGASTAQITDRIEEFRKKYENIGKSFEASDSLKKAQSQLLRFNDLFQKAKLDKESFEASGDLNAKGYELAVENFYKYGNAIENIKQKIIELNHTPVKLDFDFSKMSEAELDKALGFPKIHTWNNQVSEANESLLQETRETASEFSGIWSGIALPDLGSRIKELGEKLSQLEIPPIREESLDKLSASLEKAERKLDELRANLENGLTMGRITEDVSDSGYVKLQEQIALTEKTAAALRDRIKEVGKESKNATGIKAVGKAAKSASDSFSDLAKSGAKASNSLKKVQSGLKSVLRALLPILGIRELINLSKKSVESIGDYMESFNFYDVAFNKVASEWSGDFEKYGYQNASSYAESFTDRMDSTFQKLSGVSFEINAEGKGLLSETGLKNLGLNIQEITQYASQLASVTNSLGLVGEASLATSSAFTKLAGDISSLFNVDYKTAADNLQSGLIGQSRALYKYGTDITNATLQTKAYEIGLTKAVSEMAQAEKMQLRVLSILEQSKVAWGDQARTLNQFANQMRFLKNGVQELSTMFGQLFIPTLTKILPVINGVVIAIKRLVGYIASLAGIELDLSGSGMSGMEEDLGDISDGFESVAASTKKAKAGLRAFDELKVINMPDTSGVAAGGAGAGIDLTDEILKATEEYEKAWSEAFKNMENKAQEWADKIEKALEPIKKIFQDFAIGDFFQAGKDVSALVVSITDFFADAIDNVDWYGIGKKIGDFLAGIDWLEILKSVGNLIWQGLKAAFELYVGAFSSAPLETALISLVAFPKLLKAITASKFITGIGKLWKNFKVWGEKISLVTGTLAGNKAAASGLYMLYPKLGAKVDAVKTAFSKFFSSVKTNGFWKTVDGGITNIRNNLGGLQKAAIVAVAGFAEFSVVSDSMEKITLGTGNLLAEIGKIAGVVAAAGAAMYVALGPAGLVMAAVTGLTAGIIGVETAMQQINAETIGNTIRNALENPGGVSMDEIAGAFNEKMSSIASSFDNVSQHSQALETAQTNIKNTYGEISAIESAMNQGAISVEEGVKRINDAFSGLSTDFNDAITALEQGIIGALGEGSILRQYLAAMGYDVEALNGIVVGDVANIQKEFDKLTAEYESIKESTNPEDITRKEEIIRTMAAISGVFDETSQNMTAFKTSVENMHLNMGSVINTEDIGAISFESERFGDSLQSMVDSYNSASNSIEQGNETFQNNLATLNNMLKAAGIEENTATYSEIMSKIPGITTSADADLKEAFGGIIATIQQDALNEIPALIEQAGKEWETLDFETRSELNYQGITNKDSYIASVVKSYNQDVLAPMEEQINNALKSLNIDEEGVMVQKAQELYDSLFYYDYKWDLGGGERTFKMKENWEQILQEADLPSISEKYGETTVESFSSGISDMMSLAVEAANKLMSAVDQQGLHDSDMDYGSPSKRAIEYGKWTVEGFNIGISDNAQSTIDTISSYIDKIKQTFSSIVFVFEEIGKMVMQGFESGMSQMEGGLYDKANSIADNITQTVKSALEIHSPSRVMFELGDYTMQGFKEGMENLYNPITDSIKAFSYDVAVAPAPSFSDMYGGYVNPTVEYTPQYGGNSGIAGMSETTIYNLFYNAVSAAINNSKLMNDQKDMVEGILKKPTIEGEEIGKMSVRYIQGEERRLQKSLVGTY